MELFNDKGGILKRYLRYLTLTSLMENMFIYIFQKDISFEYNYCIHFMACSKTFELSGCLY